MHELGVLKQIVRAVVPIAEENKIEKIKFVTVEVGTASLFVPMYLLSLLLYCDASGKECLF